MSKTKTVCVVAIGDTHVGSTLGLCPSEGVALPETGRYQPSPVQSWMWGNWLDLWSKAWEIAKAEKARIVGIHMGDSVDGPAHHGTTQQISADPEVQAYLSTHALLPMRQTCEKIYMVRGTESHVGPGQDDACGRSLRAERHPDSEHSWAAHQWDLDVNKTKISARHHWSMGGLPWTANTSAVRLATQLFHEACEYAVKTGRPLNYSHIHLRGHQHRFADSGTAQPIRVLGVPSWQLATSFVHRIRQTHLADIGGIIIVCRPNGEREVIPVLYTPDAPSVVAV